MNYNLPLGLRLGAPLSVSGKVTREPEKTDANQPAAAPAPAPSGTSVSSTDVYLAKQEILDKATRFVQNDKSLTADGRKFILSNINTLIDSFANEYITKHPDDIDSLSKDFMNKYFPDGKCDTILKALTTSPVETKAPSAGDIAVTVQSGNTQNIDCSFVTKNKLGQPVTITQYSIARIGTSAGVRAEDSTFNLDPASGMLTVKAGGQPGTIYLTIIGLGADGKAYTKEVAITIENNANGKPVDDSDTIQQRREENDVEPYGNYSENNWTTDIKKAREQALKTLKNYLEDIRQSLLKEGYSQTALSVALNNTYKHFSGIITNMTDQVSAKHRNGKVVKTPDGTGYTQITRYDDEKMFDGKRGRGNINVSPSGLYLLEDKNAFKKNQYQIAFDKDVVLDRFVDEYKKAGGSNGSVKPGVVD